MHRQLHYIGHLNLPNVYRQLQFNLVNSTRSISLIKAKMFDHSNYSSFGCFDLMWSWMISFYIYFITMEQWGHCWIHTCTIPKKAKANVFKIYLLAIATKGWSPKGWRGKENTLPMKQWVGFENGTFGPQSNALQCHSEFQEYHKHYCSQRFSTILHAEGTKNSDDYQKTIKRTGSNKSR